MRISILDVQGYQFRDLDFNSNWNIGHIDKRKIQKAPMRFSFLQKIFRYGFTLIAIVIDLKLPLSGSKWFYTLLPPLLQASTRHWKYIDYPTVIECIWQINVLTSN